MTHRAVDALLELPTGSTSYYFRTRHALIDAIAHHIVATSRSDFEASGLTVSAGRDHENLARDIALSLDGTLAHRTQQLIARTALSIELPSDSPLHAALATSVFSRPNAVALFRALGTDDPETAAADFVSLCEGLIFDRVVGARSLDGLRAGTDASIDQLAHALDTYLRGALTRW
ncbi:TetR/AcrR family transcriptional regulator [Antrihabitans cavernicola]|nr:TetR family transcriptional regulator [Spelaeibacter cavernicola]